jgi:hypothetical protein
MFFSKRRKWNNEVASHLPSFNLTIEEIGPFAALEALDLVYPKGFSSQEGAMYLAYLSYSTFLKQKDQRATSLKSRLSFVESEWIKAGRINPRNAEMWRAKAVCWERGVW